MSGARGSGRGGSGRGGSGRGGGRDWRKAAERRDREAQRRNQGRRARDELDRKDYDPTAVTDEDWTVGDGPGLKRVRGPQPVADVVSNFLDRTGWADRVRTTRVLDDWSAIVGPDIAANSQPRRVERGTLHLRVASTTWATQLTWLESTIIEKVNAAAGRELVARVRIEVGELRPPDEQA